MNTKNKPYILHRVYLPPDEEGAYKWGGNFNEEITKRLGAPLGVTTAEQTLLTQTYAVLTHTREFKTNAAEHYHECVSNYRDAAWGKTPLTIRPFTARTSLATNETTPLGYFQAAIPIADRILTLGPDKCHQGVKDALLLNPLPKHVFDLANEQFYFSKLDNLHGVTTVEWEKRHSDGAIFKYRELNTEHVNWHLIGTMLRSPAVLPIPVHATVREVELIARYVKGNDEVGHWSLPQRLTIWPAQ